MAMQRPAKPYHVGSTPILASISRIQRDAPARVAESVDAADLKSADLWSCRFESGPGHHKITAFSAFEEKV